MVIEGIRKGTTIGVIKEDTRTLGHSSYDMGIMFLYLLSKVSKPLCPRFERCACADLVTKAYPQPTGKYGYCPHSVTVEYQIHVAIAVNISPRIDV